MTSLASDLCTENHAFYKDPFREHYVRVTAMSISSELRKLGSLLSPCALPGDVVTKANRRVGERRGG